MWLGFVSLQGGVACFGWRVSVLVFSFGYNFRLSHSAASLVDNLPALEKCGKRSSFLLHAKSSDATMLFEAHTQGGTSDNEASVLDEAYNCSPGEFSKVTANSSGFRIERPEMPPDASERYQRWNSRLRIERPRN